MPCEQKGQEESKQLGKWNSRFYRIWTKKKKKVAIKAYIDSYCPLHGSQFSSVIPFKKMRWEIWFYPISRFFLILIIHKIFEIFTLKIWNFPTLFPTLFSYVHREVFYNCMPRNGTACTEYFFLYKKLQCDYYITYCENIVRIYNAQISLINMFISY